MGFIINPGINWFGRNSFHFFGSNHKKFHKNIIFYILQKNWNKSDNLQFFSIWDLLGEIQSIFWGSVWSWEKWEKFSQFSERSVWSWEKWEKFSQFSERSVWSMGFIPSIFWGKKWSWEKSNLDFVNSFCNDFFTKLL